LRWTGRETTDKDSNANFENERARTNRQKERRNAILQRWWVKERKGKRRWYVLNATCVSICLSTSKLQFEQETAIRPKPRDTGDGLIGMGKRSAKHLTLSERNVEL
jgi:hypothetical protein